MQKSRIPQTLKKRPVPKGPNLLSWLFFVALIFLVFWAFTTPVSKPRELPVSEVMSLIKGEEVKKIEVEGDTLTVILSSDEEVISKKEPGSSFLDTLSQAGVDIALVSEGIIVKEGFPWVDILVSLLPVILIGFIFFFFLRQARGGASDILSFGRSRAELFRKGRQPKVTFKNVAGVDEAKRELEEVVDFLKHPSKYRALGARIPKGVLLVGAAGTGKTEVLIARIGFLIEKAGLNPGDELLILSFSRAAVGAIP